MLKRGPRKSSSRGEIHAHQQQQHQHQDIFSGNSFGGYYDNINEKLILQRATRELVELFGLVDPNLLKVEI